MRSESRPHLLLAPLWLTLGTLLVAPLLIVVAYSLSQRGIHGGFAPSDQQLKFVKTFQFTNTYARTFDATILTTLWRSLVLGVATTVLCVLISFPVAYYLAIVAAPRWRGLLVALIVIPFWTSFLIRTYAWMLILRPEGLINTALGLKLELLYTNFAVMLGLVYGELPFMILPLYASLEKLDRTLLEASQDLGAGTVSTFFRVTVPLAMPGLIAGIVLVFVPSVGQFVVSELLGGGKADLLGNVIQRQFTSARDKPFGSALAVELTLMVLAVLGAYAIYSKRRGQEIAL